MKGSFKRKATMVITAVLAAVTILWMQGKYEDGDKRNALNVVQHYRSTAGVTIPDLLAHHHPGRAVQWSTAVESSCFQHVRVHAVVAEDPAAQPVVYAFTVDINGPSIHPANDGGSRLLAEINAPIPAASASAAAGGAPP